MGKGRDAAGGAPGYIPAHDVAHRREGGGGEGSPGAKQQVNLWQAVVVTIFQTLKPYLEIYRTMKAALPLVGIVDLASCRCARPHRSNLGRVPGASPAWERSRQGEKSQTPAEVRRARRFAKKWLNFDFPA